VKKLRKQVNLKLNDFMLKKMDEAVSLNFAGNRNELIRDAIRDHLRALGLWKTK